MSKNLKDDRSYAGWIEKFYKCSNVLFAASSILLLKAIIILLFCGNNNFSYLIYFLDAAAIKALASSVSLTGLVMAWFLHAVKDHECGQAMTEVIKHIFPWYHWNILVFFVSSAISIFFAGTNNLDGNVALIPKETDIVISALALLSTLLAIVNIARLCAKILFSYKKRRDAAFSSLYTLIKKGGDRERYSAFEKWITEIRVCIDNVETSHLEGFFRALCLIEQNRTRIFNYLTDVVQNIQPISNSYYGKQVLANIKDFILPNELNSDKKDKIRDLFLKLYIIALGDATKQSGDLSPNELVESYRLIWENLWGFKSPEKDEEEFYCKCILYYYAYISTNIVDYYGGSFDKILVDFAASIGWLRDRAKKFCPELLKKSGNFLTEICEEVAILSEQKRADLDIKTSEYIFNNRFLLDTTSFDS